MWREGVQLLKSPQEGSDVGGAPDGKESVPKQGGGVGRAASPGTRLKGDVPRGEVLAANTSSAHASAVPRGVF